MIRHTVVFRLKHTRGSADERAFLQEAEVLATIPVVKAFACLRQVNPTSPFDFCLSMQFDNSRDYQIYNENPTHVRFVQTRWMPEVREFMELDYEVYTSSDALD